MCGRVGRWGDALCWLGLPVDLDAMAVGVYALERYVLRLLGSLEHVGAGGLKTAENGNDLRRVSQSEAEVQELGDRTEAGDAVKGQLEPVVVAEDHGAVVVQPGCGWVEAEVPGVERLTALEIAHGQAEMRQMHTASVRVVEGVDNRIEGAAPPWKVAPVAPGGQRRGPTPAA